MRKFILKSAEGVIAADGKLEIPKGTSYTTLTTMVELDIKNGKNAGSKFIVSEVGKEVDKSTVDQYFVAPYRGKAGPRTRPEYVLTFRPAGAAANESVLICTLFRKDYVESKQHAFAGKKGTVRFYLEDLEQATARDAARLAKRQA